MPYNPSDLRLPPWLVRLMDRMVRIEIRLGPWRLGLTRPGALFLAALLGVCAAALYSGNNLLYLCGAMLVVFAAAGLISGAILLHRLPPLTPLMPDHTLAGISRVIREFLTVQYPFPALVDISWMRAGRKEPSLTFGMHLSRGRVKLSGTMRAERRGIESLQYLVFETSAPLGLWRLSLKREENWEWVVVPMPVAMCDRYESYWQITKTPGDEWSDLRAYVPGDPRSRIHWRKLAAGISDPKQWLVKQFESGFNDDQTFLLRVDMRLPAGMAPEAIDRLLGQAVTWVSNFPRDKPDGRRMIVGSEACDTMDVGIWRLLAKAGTETKPPSGQGGRLLSLVGPI